MAKGLSSYTELFGDDFDTIIKSFRAGLTPEVENMLMATMDGMLFDARTFTNNIEKRVTMLSARGMNPELIKQTLKTDMQDGGRVFGQLRNDVKENIAGAVNQSGRLGQFSEYENFKNFLWVTVAGHKVCPDCDARAGAVLTYEEWEGEGLPGAGWSVCQGYCYCILDPIGLTGKKVDAPIKGEPKARSAKSTESTALKDLDLSKAEMKAYKKGMNLESKGAKDVLKRKGLTQEEALKQVSEHRAKLQSVKNDTKDLYYNKATKSYSRDRAIMHNRIARNITQRGQIAKNNPDLLMTGGYPGSGKSTMLDKAFKGWESKYVHLDSDYIKGALASLDDTTITWNAGLYHEEADDIIKIIFQKTFNEKRHLLFDGTMKNGKKMIDIIEQFNGKGNYNPFIAFSDLPMEKTIERAVLRSVNNGRFVEPAYVVTHLGKNIKSYEMLKEYFKDIIKYTKYDNDVDFGFDPILLESNL